MPKRWQLVAVVVGLLALPWLVDAGLGVAWVRIVGFAALITDCP